jgi:hypothetical protein
MLSMNNKLHAVYFGTMSALSPVCWGILSMQTLSLYIISVELMFMSAMALCTRPYIGAIY